MVLLAAAVATKAGKVIISRQFVEMSRARIEGLLAAFPKLLGGEGKQHTFVETESVRYVYQPLEKLFALLVTTRTSNILEDLETLRLFSRLIPEYCKNMDEQDIVENAFNLIFAFDEIIALGYRESVNLAQIRTFVEMDSHEEKVYQAVRQTQEREAKQKMKEKARELQKARQDANRKGGGRTGAPPSFGFGSAVGSTPSMVLSADTLGPSGEPQKPSYLASSRAGGPTKALKLGSKQKEWDTFADQLKQEGEQIANPTSGKLNTSAIKSAISSPTTPVEPVILNVEEKVTLIAQRDGGLQNLEVHGLITLRITEEQFARIKVLLDTCDEKGVQIQTHPNIDKEVFKSSHQVMLKNPSKPFPLNCDVGVLKWRFQTQDEKMVPLSINCWVSETGSGGCDVNIEYELEQEHLQLNNVVISIPLMTGSGAPVVNDCEGDYHYDSRKGVLEWQLPVIDAANKSSAMEFSAPGKPNDFYPVTVNFIAKTLYCNIRVVDVVAVDDETPVKHSLSTYLLVDKYEII